jgi:FtsH-binding integral membrane protein
VIIKEEFQKMNTPNTNTRARSVSSYDEGLRSHFRGVYNVMSISLVITGLVAYLTANSPLAAVLYGNPIIAIAVAFAPLAFIFFGFTPKAVQRKSSGQLKTLMFLFSAVFGLSLSSVFLVYAGADIARAFFIAAATFAATSVYGYVTKKDLSGLGGLLIMGVIGILIAAVVNIFLQSSALDFAISVIGVLVYTGLVAYDTQNIKETYAASHGTEANSKMAVMGALSLYINFIMLFQFILSLLGNRE